MKYSFSTRQDDQKQRMLSRKDLDGLTQEERQYAEEQFRLLYAEQMSKLSMEMSHKKKILDNLNSIDEKQKNIIKEQSDYLKNKMGLIERKRNEQLEIKKKHYKQNEERWEKKLKDIQMKFKQKNREAIQKAQQYRDQSEKFWKSKEKKAMEHQNYITLSSVRQNKINTIPDFNKSVTVNKSKKKFNKMEEEMKKQELNQQIFQHQKKSESLKKEKEDYVFQKAMEKMDKIQKQRQKITKKNQAKVQPTKPRKPTNAQSEPRKKRQKSSSGINNLGMGKPKQSLEKLIKEHIDAKQKLEERSFEERGKIVDQSHQRNRKDKIKKMLRNKVYEMKVNALKNEGSTHNLSML